MQNKIGLKRQYKRKIRDLQKYYIENGLDVCSMKQYYSIFAVNTNSYEKRKIILIILVLFVFSAVSAHFLISGVVAVRCLLPNNYLVWEATRPISNCSYCLNITRPLILRNVSRESFMKYAYLPRPIIVKDAIKHWKAKELSFETLAKLYIETPGSYESIDDGCQFLNFKTDLFSLKEVFSMPQSRVMNENGQQPWYVGWGNCHPDILNKLRQFYSVPDFLPEDAEFPATENIFIGYEIGAVMHLDYISRLMWQGQVKGNKTWKVAPVPECDHVCESFEYYVEPGDIGNVMYLQNSLVLPIILAGSLSMCKTTIEVLLDTRNWYHATSIPKGQFSLTVQSEYG